MINFCNLTNYELCVIGKAFSECGNRKWCDGCPCDGTLCSVPDLVYAREAFQNEIINRLMMD